MRWKCSQIARFMGPTWGPSGSCRSQMGPMLASWTLLSGFSFWWDFHQWVHQPVMKNLSKCCYCISVYPVWPLTEIFSQFRISLAYLAFDWLTTHARIKNRHRISRMPKQNGSSLFRLNLVVYFPLSHYINQCWFIICKITRTISNGNAIKINT